MNRNLNRNLNKLIVFLNQMYYFFVDFIQPVAESIGYAAASILEGTIPNAYRESFQNVLLPGFEKASMAMFMQINQTFQQGTKQCKCLRTILCGLLLIGNPPVYFLF